jgi:oligosaccharide repeat unit polymerase
MVREARAEPATARQQSGESRLTRNVLVIHIGATIAICGFAYWVLSAPVASDALVAQLSVGLLVLGAWELGSWWCLNGTIFTPYGLFLISALAFNAGQAFLQPFGLNDRGLLDGAFAVDVLADTLVAVAVGLAWLHLGALFAIARQPARSGPIRAGLTATKDRSLRVTGLALSLVALPASVIVWSQAAQTVTSFGYNQLYAVVVPTGLAAAPQLLANFLIPGSLLMLAGSVTDKRWTVASGLLMVAFTATQLFLGRRGPGLMAAVAWLWLYHVAIGRLKTSLLAGGAALLILVVLPVIQTTRDLSGSQHVDYLSALGQIHNPATATISEMGYSMSTVGYTLQLIPSVRPFDYGGSYLTSLASAMPNVLGLTSAPYDPHAQYGIWLIDTINPYLAAKGYALGFSFIAEAYANFGWPGLALLSAFGAAFVKAEVWINRTKDPAKVATVASALAFILTFPRSESLYIVRPIVWYALIPYLIYLFARRESSFRWRSNRPMTPADQRDRNAPAKWP